MGIFLFLDFFPLHQSASYPPPPSGITFLVVCASLFFICGAADDQGEESVVLLVVVIVVVGETIFSFPCTVFRGVKRINFVSKGV